MIEKFASSYGKSYKTRQIGGKFIKGAFHGGPPYYEEAHLNRS